MFNILPDKEVCANCKHYHQHYVPGGSGYIADYVPCSFGHCSYPRTKIRRCVHPGCEHFQMRKGLTK